MSVSEQLREEAKEITILKSILALMKNLDWDVEKTMDAIDLAEDERDLYRRSVQHYLEHPEDWPQERLTAQYKARVDDHTRQCVYQHSG